MSDLKIQQIWQASYQAFAEKSSYLSDIQRKASRAILNCKTGNLGVNISQCPDCGHLDPQQLLQKPQLSELPGYQQGNLG